MPVRGRPIDFTVDSTALRSSLLPATLLLGFPGLPIPLKHLARLRRLARLPM
jgi:hypothetical protein